MKDGSEWKHVVMMMMANDADEWIVGWRPQLTRSVSSTPIVNKHRNQDRHHHYFDSS